MLDTSGSVSRTNIERCGLILVATEFLKVIEFYITMSIPIKAVPKAGQLFLFILGIIC